MWAHHLNNIRLNTMNTLQLQFAEMLQRGRIPYLEYEITLNGEDDYLLVELTCLENGIEFSFDSNGLPASFDGSIKQLSDNYFFMPFDNYDAGENDSDNLDYYLQGIDENITTGFIYSNDLFRNED
jgi:hypothetical protein